MHTDVHPEEEPSGWEIAGFWAVILTITVTFWYAVARWVILPIVRRVWPLVQPLISLLQQYADQLLLAAVLAAFVMMVWSIIREG